MDFSFDDTQRALQGLARDVFTDLATHDRLKELAAGGQSFDHDLWTALEGAGLLDVGVTEGGFLEQCVLLVEQGHTVAPVPLWSHLLATTVAGPSDGILTLALDGLVEAGDGITGAKEGVQALDVASAVVVSAGDALYLVATDGLRSERRETTAGFPEFAITFDATPAQRIEGDGAQLALRAVVALCALGVGVAERALELTAAYTSERKQFDRPLGSFQAVQQRAADAYIDVEAMRSTMWQAAWRLSEGLEAAREVAIAKFWAAEGGQRVVSAAQHLHGGLGADIDYPLHRYTLWAKWIELSFGGATQQLARLGAELA
jgi:alkylation response protein AidB-like acyl-CoA dehydrogenase